MLRETFQKIALTILLIFLPSQLGWHFWPDWSFVDGVRVDYLSPTLYMTDFLVGTIIILELIKLKKRDLIIFLKENRLRVILSVSFVLANTFFSISPAVTTYKWFRFFEMLFLGVVIIKRLPHFFSRRLVAIFLGIGILLSSSLALWQFLAQKSVGGWWYFLGERAFTQMTPGIANAFFSGQLVLRPYGTFPHPNVLAGFLAVSLLFVSAVFLREKRVKFHDSLLSCLFLSTVLIVGYTAIFATLSRAAIFSYLIGLFLLLAWRAKRIPTILVGTTIFLAVFLTLGQRIVDVSIETEPIFSRIQFVNIAWKNFLMSPILGLGAGTAPLGSGAIGSIYALRFQPPHSVFLVVLSETGVFGIGALILLFTKAFLFAWKKLWLFEPLPIAVFLCFIVTGMVDHYWLTLAQGNLSLIVVGGVVLSTWTS